jgi:hypothetical protein
VQTVASAADPSGRAAVRFVVAERQKRYSPLEISVGRTKRDSEIFGERVTDSRDGRGCATIHNGRCRTGEIFTEHVPLRAPHAVDAAVYVGVGAVQRRLAQVAKKAHRHRLTGRGIRRSDDEFERENVELR